MHKTALALFAALVLVLPPSIALAGASEQQTEFLPGAPGVGDPYFPLDGNGGYDVRHYLLDVNYDPPTNVLTGVATIQARATQDLSRFNLDFDGLTIRSITVNEEPATWRRDRGELSVTPSAGLRDGRLFTSVVHYDGVPKPIVDEFGESGFFHTDDGTLVIGEPHVASTWFPVNDHPSDKAAYTFRITVPKGLEAVANGTLQRHRISHGLTTWKWKAEEPMASYLATASVGEFDLNSYREGGIEYVDAIDPDLFDPVAVPHTGNQFMISQRGEPAFKRLARTIRVPAGGAKLSFWVTRDTEPGWDFMFVEAHTVGRYDWTTLRDLNGHTSKATGFSCPFWLGLHPVLRRYQSARADDTCAPQGTTGRWWAASGASDGAERWQVDLSKYAGSEVRVMISYASDESVQLHGVFVDDIALSSGPGTTSFEEDGNTRDGWEVPGAPKGSKRNPNDWIVGTMADTPEPLGASARASFQRQGEIIDFLSDHFGPYPFSAAGGIVDDLQGLGFALENQTRPIYSKDFFYDPVNGDAVVVHELAHQWYGNSLAVASWRNIWLNEGFATYAEWLWSEREGLGTAQEIFDFFYGIPARDPFWALRIGNPGPRSLFDFPVYARGAMTLHRLRVTVGDEDFFKILRQWAQSRSGDSVRTSEFVALAERISGRSLDALFSRWLFTTEKPFLAGTAASRLSSPTALRAVPNLARVLVDQSKRDR
jgi:hypothetical protein